MIVPLVVPAVDLPVLSFSYHLPISFVFFHFCVFDVQVALFSVVLDHLKCLGAKFMRDNDFY